MRSVWQDEYQNGVVNEIDMGTYDSLPAIFEESFSKYAEKRAFYCMGSTLTYAQLDNLSQKFASYLQNDLNLTQGDRVALMMPNILQYPVALFGILRAGMVAVNINPLYTARELEHQLKDSGSKAIVIFENSASVLEKVIKKTPVEHVMTTQIGDMLSFVKKHLVNFVIKKVKKMIPEFHFENSISFVNAVAAGNSSSFTKPKIEQNDTAFLQYTGGTTGVSKGAELLHKNIIANILQIGAWLGPTLKDGEEIVITPLPLYHIFSLTANCFSFTRNGALNVLIPNPRDMKGFIKEISNWEFTAITGVNTLFNGLLAQEDFKNLNFSKLKISLGGGMAVQQAVAEKWESVTGAPLVEAYGLTETSPAVCVNPINLPAYNGMIGLPIPSTDVVVKDDEGNNLPVGEAGEICVKGPQVMNGYWGRPDETEKVTSKDGYFKTGDVGVMDEKGYFKLVDRKKDMILVSGFNVYPNEIEDIVCSHPKVFECAAIGVPDEKSGEIVKVFVVKDDDTLTEAELKSFCRENLTGYKVPKVYQFKADLPKSNVGKILRKDLRGL